MLLSEIWGVSGSTLVVGFQMLVQTRLTSWNCDWEQDVRGHSELGDTRQSDHAILVVEHSGGKHGRRPAQAWLSEPASLQPVRCTHSKIMTI